MRRAKSDDESTVASTDRKKRSSSSSKKDHSKEADLQKELEELRKEIAKNKNESNVPREMDDVLKRRRETNGHKYISAEDELRGEIASLREEIKMNHRESPALRHGGAAYESRGYHESPGVASYSVAREYQSPGIASYASAPARESYCEPERRSTFRRRFDDEEDAYLDNQPMPRAHSSRRGGRYEDYEYERESRLSSRFSSPRMRSPGGRKSKYYL